MIKEEQNPTGPVLTAAESRRRVLHNMCSSLLYNLSVILFGLLLPRLYLTSFGSELNGLDSTIKQIFSCLTLLEAGVGLASQQAYYLPVAVGDGKAINGIFSATHHYYRRTGIVYLLVTVVFALLYPLCINTVLSYGTVSLIVVFYGIPGIVSYLVQGKYRSFMEVEGKNYVITYITTATMAAGNLLRMLALLFTRSILLVQVTYCVPSVFQVLVLTAQKLSVAQRARYPQSGGAGPARLGAGASAHEHRVQQHRHDPDLQPVRSGVGQCVHHLYAVFLQHRKAVLLDRQQHQLSAGAAVLCGAGKVQAAVPAVRCPLPFRGLCTVHDRGCVPDAHHRAVYVRCDRCQVP